MKTAPFDAMDELGTNNAACTQKRRARKFPTEGLNDHHTKPKRNPDMLRRTLLALTPAALLMPRRTMSQSSMLFLDRNNQDVNGKQLGDDGFLHAWLHQYYQKYFPLQNCPCHDGECRPTTWRRDPKNLRVLQAWINRKWVSADKDTKVQDRRDIPADFPKPLMDFDAHACSYNGTTITCLWILNATI